LIGVTAIVLLAPKYIVVLYFFTKKKWSANFLGNISKLEHKYFEILLINVTAIVLSIPECKVVIFFTPLSTQP
jgi:hypothetical protein